MQLDAEQESAKETFTPVTPATAPAQNQQEPRRKIKTANAAAEQSIPCADNIPDLDRVSTINQLLQAVSIQTLSSE